MVVVVYVDLYRLMSIAGLSVVLLFDFGSLCLSVLVSNIDQ